MKSTKSGKLLKFPTTRFFQELGEMSRITFLILLVILLITMLFIALAPFTVEKRISLDHFIIAVTITGILAALLPHEENEAEAKIEPEKRSRLWSFITALVIGIAVSLAIFYSIKDTRLALLISSLSGLFAVMLTLIYRGKIYT